MEFLAPFLQREVIIASAVVGAVIATVGGVLLKKPDTMDPDLAGWVRRIGYAVSWGSVALFILAGFSGA